MEKGGYIYFTDVPRDTNICPKCGQKAIRRHLGDGMVECSICKSLSWLREWFIDE